jgi:NADH-quinone oxidoreductase subunit N
MSIDSLILLSPWMSLSVAILGVLLISAFMKTSTLAFTTTLVGFFVALGCLFLIPQQEASVSFLLVDSYTKFYVGLILMAAAVVVLFSRQYFKTHFAMSEYYLLILLATLGSTLLMASSHFATLFLGLEILSVSLYTLIAYRTEKSSSGSGNPIEAAAKYLVLAGTSSAFLLFGMALVYFSFGTMDFAHLGSRLQQAGDTQLLPWIGLSMIMVGVAFKLSLAPFHMWAPDVYEGAPAPVTAFIATVSKGAVFAFFLRWVIANDLHRAPSFFIIASVLAVASMVIGNVTALQQNNVKRLLAYSSISHLGYLIVPLLSGVSNAPQTVAFYLTQYFITTLAAFGVVCVTSTPQKEADQLRDYQGLFWRRPLIATLFSLSILSLAGIPLTSGFIGKFFLISTSLKGALWFLVLVLVLNSAIGLFYYLRIVFALFSLSPISLRTRRERAPLFLPNSMLLLSLSVLLIWLGVYPSPFLHFIQTMQ